MRLARKVAIGLGGTLAVWLAALALFGWLGAGCQKRRVEARLAARMQATVAIGDLELGLVRGRVGLDDLMIEREAGLRLAIDRIDADILPLGLALFRRGAGDVVVRGVDIELSSLAALDSRRGRGPPFHFDSMRIDDADLALSAIRFLPDVTVHLERAVCGATTLRTPMSWLFALRELDATVALPGGATARLEYADGVIRLSGTLIGDEPIELPFVIPVLEPSREIEQLAEMGVALAKELGRQLLAPR